LTGPAGLKTLPYGAVERLHACEQAGILTYFQRKVNTKFLLLRLPEALRCFKSIHKTRLTFDYL
jgi:hypothetical protein